ncbi:AmmeMemoRadiSam system radical SAM enzyme [Desulfonatronospira sp.]|uniref:AmmeMemoRadiSam system radical SAM enzyme n=1 Tax=Desulfonatronospira sp. TaxID=1962951 RepID=UPI0025BCB5E6|nr:AmmeMemoRadiSam system radical SAM enzyme [Desulfonatronospira sp.]
MQSPKPAVLWKPLKENQIQCQACSQFCLIEQGERGICGVRRNTQGQLFTLVGDNVAALNVDPVEKKPLFHFMPGSTTLSLGTMGCNFSCSFCQNYTLSQPPKEHQFREGQPITPEQLVNTAREYRAGSISYTYSEPTVFIELVLETARRAKDRKLKNIIVSNGFQSPDCLKEMNGVIDAANIDLKAFTETFYRDQCRARLKPVLDNLVKIREMGWWLEVTTLVIPGLNDSIREIESIAGFIGKNLGAHTPWHISRFHPTFNLTDRQATPVETIEMAWQAGKKAGLEYVYTGNIPGHDGENTCCPGCGEVVVSRLGFQLRGVRLDKGACAACGRAIAGYRMSGD